MRITTSVILFWLWFTASAALLEAVGVAEAMGVTSEINTGDSLDKAVQGLNDIQGGGVSAESVMGLYVIGTGALETFVVGLTAGPRILINVGIPEVFVVFLHAPVALLAGRMILYGLTQREL